MHWPPNADGITRFAREVWPLVVQQEPDAMLTVIGKNPPAALGNGSVQNVEITGYVKDPAPYLSETAAFIVPLHAGGGMRVKILDAWCWGLPVVSTTIGAEGLRYEDQVNLLIGDGAEQFAAAVVSLIRSPGQARELITGGRKTVEEHYDWRKVYQAWDEVYSPAT
jgi:glycosyltransferase involved in cell wall biosynthesis